MAKVECEGCGRKFDSEPAFCSHWGRMSDDAHDGPVPEHGGYPDEHGENVSKSLKGVNAGKNNPAWRGGYEETNLTAKQKQSIRDQLGNRCQVDESHESIAGRSFDIAHLDGDVENNEPDNLTVLCRRCHSKYDWGKRDLADIQTLADVGGKIPPNPGRGKWKRNK